MIELAEVISELRRELDQAINAGHGERLRFELGPVELEATIGVDRQGGAGAKVRFWVIDLNGDKRASSSSTQRIKLTLQPRLAGSDTAPQVSGAQVPGER